MDEAGAQELMRVHTSLVDSAFVHRPLTLYDGVDRDCLHVLQGYTRGQSIAGRCMQGS